VFHPTIRELFNDLQRHPAFQSLLTRLARGSGEKQSLSGLNTTAKALYAVLLYQLTERPLFLVTDGSKQAEALYEAIDTFYHILALDEGEKPQLLPALDVVPGQGMSPHAEILETRAAGLWKLSTRRVPITVTPIASALLRIESAAFYRQLATVLRRGDEIPQDDLIQHLESVGYERREPVEMVGEYSVRGGIIDVFSPGAKPVRIEMFGDEIESIRRFEVESQRSVLKVSDCTLLPLTEYQRTRPLLAELVDALREAGMASRELPIDGSPFGGWELLIPLIRERQGNLFSLTDRPIVIWDEPELTRAAADRLWKRLEDPDRPSWTPPERVFRTYEQLREVSKTCSEIDLRELDVTTSTEALHISTRPAVAFHGSMAAAIAEARNLVDAGQRVAFFGSTAGEVERVADIFHEYNVAYQLGLEQNTTAPEYLAQRAYMAGNVANIFLIQGRISRGTVLQDSGVAIFGSEDLFDSSALVAKPSATQLLSTFSADNFDLKPGDYVVHAEHGVARFLGLREISTGDAQGDYMLLEYAGGSKLYVPLTRMDLIERFRGAGESAPPLDRMGGATWIRTKTKVKAKMRDMAEELLKLYAQRRMAVGFTYSPDSNWQREFEDAFEYSETKDQRSAIADIKRDMESPQPMDRLICGDVGFGKTEVVMRAAFKALGDGKQVAVLAPTTVLSFQHFETFKRRFQSFPVRIEMFNRFRSPKELKAGLGDLAEGKVDVAVGTHRLLSKDVEFKDLGLVIVDEEQRFGVTHKERLKQLKKSVDVLTMSATPIPRTLHMSMLGLRDMSVIETPPKDRLSIQTVVAPFDDALIKSALELELARGGQIYFVHNRVDSIWERAAHLQQLAPNARIGVGHGQMGEAELEKAMFSFMHHDCDIFVSTTIVENGLDIPLANTIIIENAERYGLSELYQLRGRVGRSNRRAYAYLLVPVDTELTEIARKRLAALKEFSDLGAGFKIAALDLELRGAGNLLGGEQHGHINVIGFDNYVRMLDDTVREMRGEEVLPEIHSALNLGLDIRIPNIYIADENQRLRAYRQIANAKTAEDCAKVGQELADRYGPVPDEIRNLLEYSELKTAAERIGIEAVDRRHGVLNIKFHQETRVDAAKLLALVSSTPGAQFTPAGVLRVPADGATKPAEVLTFLRERLMAPLGALTA
jgi:transcription-repair coupling factor (superfamily II helicase)